MNVQTNPLWAALFALALLVALVAAAPDACAQEPGMDPPEGSPAEPELPAPEPPLPELPPMPGPGPAGTPSGTTEQPAPPPGFDYEAYAQQTFDSARTSADAGEGPKVLAYVKYLRGPLGQTAFVKGHKPAIDELERRGQDLSAEACWKRAEELAPKNPAKAKEKLTELRGTYGSSGFVTLRRVEIEALETTVRTALWDGKNAWRGAAVLPREGVVRLTYELSAVEELADFGFAGKAAPKLEGGRLLLAKPDGVVRHKLIVSEGGNFTAEIEARGVGRIALLLEGVAPEAALPARATVIELEATEKMLQAAIGRSDEKGRPGVSAPRPAGSSASSAWHARIERTGGKIRAVLLPQGPGPATTTTAPTAAAATATAGAAPAAPAKEFAAERTAGTDLLKAPLGPSFRAGFAFLSGKVEIERMVIEAPLPTQPPGDSTASAPTRPPLPTKVWIPLSKKGKDGWTETGKWSFEGETIKNSGGPAMIVSKELEQRPLEKYTFTVDVKIDKEDAKRARMLQQPSFAILLPAGEESYAWVFTGREMRLDGADDMHLLGTLPPEQWQTLVVKADGKKIECFLGNKSIFVAAQDKIADSKFAPKAGGVAIRTFPGLDRIELRAPKIRLE